MGLSFLPVSYSLSLTLVLSLPASLLLPASVAVFYSGCVSVSVSSFLRLSLSFSLLFYFLYLLSLGTCVFFFFICLFTFASQSLFPLSFLILLSVALFLSLFFVTFPHISHPGPLTFPLSPHTFTDPVCSCTFNLMTVSNDIKVIVPLMHLHGSH